MQFHPKILLYALRDGWPVWVTVAVSLGTFPLSWLIAAALSSQHLVTDTSRYAGTFLQVFGIFTVAHGIRKTKQLFGRPPMWSVTKQWFARIRAAFSAPHVISATGISSGGAVMSGRARGVMTPGPDTPLDQRVSFLEKGLADLRDELDATNRELHQRVDKAKADLDKEALERRDEAQRTRRQLEDLAVGGISIALMGLVWLLVGVVAASLPDDGIEKLWHLIHR
jgi:hypothetical protein